jgi:MCM N-terminal domain
MALRDDGFPDYQNELDKCREFIKEYKEFGDDNYKYRDMLQAVANRELTVVEIELDDVLSVSGCSW